MNLLDTSRMWHADESIERRRRRELAGAARAGSWARARARNEQRAFVVSHWGVFAGFIGAGLMLALAVAWMMPSSFLSGVVVGASLVLVPGLCGSSRCRPLAQPHP